MGEVNYQEGTTIRQRGIAERQSCRTSVLLRRNRRILRLDRHRLRDFWGRFSPPRLDNANLNLNTLAIRTNIVATARRAHHLRRAATGTALWRWHDRESVAQFESHAYLLTGSLDKTYSILIDIYALIKSTPAGHLGGPKC